MGEVNRYRSLFGNYMSFIALHPQFVGMNFQTFQFNFRMEIKLHLEAEIIAQRIYRQKEKI
jgi:hypothetical protein